MVKALGSILSTATRIKAEQDSQVKLEPALLTGAACQEADFHHYIQTGPRPHKDILFIEKIL